MKVFQLPAVIESVRTMADRSLQLKVGTQELNPNEKARVFDLHNKPVWLAVAEQEIKPEDIEVGEERVAKAEKSPSQRLRAVLFVTWNQKGSSMTFDEYYKHQVNLIISRYKEKLDDK